MTEPVRLEDREEHGDNGHNLSVIGKLLGHSKIATTQRYANLADAPVHRTNEQIGSKLAASLGG